MQWSYVTLALFVFQALGLWLAVDVVMRGRTAQGSVAWALALILLPWLSVPLYLVFGERKFAGYVRARRRGRSGIDAVARTLSEQLGPFMPPLPGDGALPALTKLARQPFTAANQLDLLVDGNTTFEAIIAAIEGASTYVLVQFYIFRADGIGQRLQTSLLNARSRGVRVYLLYDEIGSFGLPRSYLDTLAGAGCECSGFRTKPRKQRPFRINFRNHRKIVVVDGRAAFVGGLNVGDEYLGLHPTLTPWRDTHVRVRGPAVQCVQLTFLEDWYWATRVVPPLEWSPEPADSPGARVLVAPSGPADELDACSLMFTAIANSARRRLWFASPYFVPDEQLLGALQLAALRGVDVRVIIPEKSDNRLAWLSAHSYYDELLPTGVKIYRYQKGFNHQKVVLCDDLACVGTANLDNRSFRINFEITMVIADPEFAGRVAEMLESDLARSRPTDPADFGKRPFWFRLACRTARLFAPIQ